MSCPCMTGAGCLCHLRKGYTSPYQFYQSPPYQSIEEMEAFKKLQEKIVEHSILLDVISKNLELLSVQLDSICA